MIPSTISEEGGQREDRMGSDRAGDSRAREERKERKRAGRGEHPKSSSFIPEKH